MAWREDAVIRQLRGVDGGPAALKVPSYTLATVPDATLWTGHLIFISDATPTNLAISNGTNWLACDDGLTAA